MIAKIVGTLESIKDDYVIIGINGVYYQIFLPSGVIQKLRYSDQMGDEISLYTLYYIEGGFGGGNQFPRLIGFLDEIDRELRLMEAEKAEVDALDQRIEELYRKLHPSDNLRTIAGVGEHTAPVFVANIGDPTRFPGQSTFANWTGVVPGAKQSSETESKGLRMTKAGPATMKWALYQAGQIGRQWDPQLALVYYRQMVYHGKNHKQAMGAVMSHMGARVFTVLREDRPYELRDTEGKPISKMAARALILTKYQVPEDIRQERRRSKGRKASTPGAQKEERMVAGRMYEAARAP